MANEITNNINVYAENSKKGLFISSDKINVFPCAYRGTRSVEILTSTGSSVSTGIDKNIAFQPTARAFTEENYVKNYPRFGTQDSYLISHSKVNDNYYVECVVGGYYFNFELTWNDLSIMAGNGATLGSEGLAELDHPRYLVIRTRSQSMDTLTAKNGTDISHHTEILSSKFDTVLKVLDRHETGGTYVFTGLEICDDVPDTADGFLQLIKSNGTGYTWLYESKTVFHNLRTGAGFNSLINLGDNLTIDACNAVGDYSMALGKETKAYGNTSIAVNDNTNAVGDNSIAAGYMSVSIGNNAYAIGYNCTASADNSIAVGDTANAVNINAVAVGKTVETDTDGQVVLGKYNAKSENNVITIGNGTAAVRHNLFNIKANGDTELQGTNNIINIGTEAKEASIHISNTVNIDNAGCVDITGNLDVANILNVCVDAQNMTLNGSFHETSTFTLGSNKSVPEVKFDTTNKTIDVVYNTINIGTAAQYITTNTTNINTSKYVTINNGIHATGRALIENGATVYNSTDIANDVHITGSQVFIGKAKNTDSTEENRHLYVAGGATVYGDATISALDITSAGVLAFKNNYFKIDSTKSLTTLSGDLTVTAKTTVNDIVANNSLTVGTNTVVIDTTNTNLYNQIKYYSESKVLDVSGASAITFRTADTATTTKITADAIATQNLTASGTQINLNGVAIDATNVAVRSKASVAFYRSSDAAEVPYFKATQDGITVESSKVNGAVINSSKLTISNVISATETQIDLGHTTAKNTKINAWGTVYANSYDTHSDERLKENISSFTDTCNILNLDVKQFTYKDDATKQIQIGCIAQDLQNICPTLVHEDSNGYLAISESKLVYLLLNEVKKLRKEVNELKEV